MLTSDLSGIEREIKKLQRDIEVLLVKEEGTN